MNIPIIEAIKKNRDCFQENEGWNNISKEVHIVSNYFNKFVFKHCHFKKESWIDMTTFKKCKFINCTIEGEMRWVKFLSCEFENVTFDLNYMRESLINKSSKAFNLRIKIRKIDGYARLFGERRKQDNPWEEYNEYIQLK